jgi:4-hydroxybenzoate polyprenyltransferase
MATFKHYLQLIRVDKPIGTLLLLWPTLWALFFASGKVPSLKYIIGFSLGVFLTRASGCVFNDVADVDFDKFVFRTKNRPLVSGVIARKQAIMFGVGLSVLAFILALIVFNIKAVLLSIPALIIYVTYPLFKRFFAVPQAYLGVAFSFGILMAFMQMQNHLSGIAWLVFAANLFWVVGYDTIYALIDIDDDLVVGIKTSAITFGEFVVPVVAVCYLIFILIMVYVGMLLELRYSYFVACLLSFLVLLYQTRILLLKQKSKYFKLFLINNWVGAILFAGVLLAYL